VVVLTLGLNEVWFDQKLQRHLNCAPSYYATKREADRFELHVTTVQENINELEKIRERLVQMNPSVRIIVTVSPVPMSDTFSGRDVFIANTFSKSTLRVAAQIFADCYDNTDYFPSFDMVTMSPRDRAYGFDCLYVTDSVVRKIMQEFLRLYVGCSIDAAAFSELAYLEANPDVEAALRLGQLASGFEHWILFGKEEGRLLSPEGGPTPLMIAAAAI
jgi:hypothetical protein